MDASKGVAVLKYKTKTLSYASGETYDGKLSSHTVEVVPAFGQDSGRNVIFKDDSYWSGSIYSS